MAKSWPDPEVVTKTFSALVDAERTRPETFKVELDGIVLRAYLTEDRSENDPYFVCDATQITEVSVVINRAHPHWSQLYGSENVLNFLRHCVYDALAEHMARHKKSTIQPDTIKMFKDKFLRVPLEIEMAQGAAAAEAATSTPGS